jgi:4-amino-4-deoxy-L-arabinose transferase-like glycosyltransferase
VLSNSNTKSLASWLIDVASIVIVLSIFYAIWLGTHPLFTPDEGRYSEVAREMVKSGDYITPRLNGIVFLDKPVLYYWLQASAIKFYGLKESALRFWPACIGILGCLFVYLGGRQLFNRRTGLISAFILATSPLYYGAAHYANLDLEVASFISITLLCFLMAIQAKTTSLKNTLLIATYVFSALAVLTKGLIGVVFPALIAGTWILLLNRWYLLKSIHLLSGLLIFACMTVPWYILVQRANPQFLHFFFVTQQLSRFLTIDTFNNQNACWFYFPIVALGFFPWTLFLIQTVVYSLKKSWQNCQQHSIDLFLILWVVIIFTFFSIPHSKTIGYILPIFPAIALLVGHYFDTHWNHLIHAGMKMGIWAYVLVTPLIFSACLIPYFKTLEIVPGLILYLTFAGGLFLMSGIIIAFIRKHAFTSIITVLILTTAAFTLTLSASSKIINQKTIKPLAIYLKNTATSEDEIVTFYKYYQDLPIYTERLATIVADWTASDIPHYDNWVRELWYGIPFQDTSQWLINESAFWQRWHSQKHLFVLMNQSYFNEFKMKSQRTVHQLGQFNEVVLVSN